MIIVSLLHTKLPTSTNENVPCRLKFIRWQKRYRKFSVFNDMINALNIMNIIQMYEMGKVFKYLNRAEKIQE